MKPRFIRGLVCQDQISSFFLLLATTYKRFIHSFIHFSFDHNDRQLHIYLVLDD